MQKHLLEMKGEKYTEVKEKYKGLKINATTGSFPRTSMSLQGCT